MKTNILFILFAFVLMSCGNSAAVSEGEKSQQSQPAAKPDSNLPAPVTKSYKTRTGKTITITESHPQGQSLSDISAGFQGEPKTVVEFKDVDPIRKVLVADLDGNGFDEVYIITTGAGSGSYGNVTGLASNADKSLTQIFFPQVEEKGLKKGATFEGYEGHDEFEIVQNTLVRTFPLKTGKTSVRTLRYGLKAGEAGFVLYLKK